MSDEVSGVSPIAKDGDSNPAPAAAADPSVEKSAAPASDAAADTPAKQQQDSSAAAAPPPSKDDNNNNNNNNNSQQQQQQQRKSAADNDPYAAMDDPSQSFAPFLEEKAQKLLKEEKWREALNAREHVLRCYLRAFGEQSNEANMQKQLLAALILKAGDFEKAEQQQQQQNNSSSALNSSTASGGGGGGNAAAAHMSPSRSDPLSDHRPRNLLSFMFGKPVGELTMSSRLEYAQLLLNPQSVGPALSEDPNLRHLRARLMLAHSTITARMHRPRSAIPMLTEAMRLLQGLVSANGDDGGSELYDADGNPRADNGDAPLTLSPANQEAARLELCESYLTKSVLLSNCGKHEDALATSMWGLAAILQLEEESWRNFQDLRGGDPNAPRAKIFHASLQAACHHNMGAEQEHLGLTELALDSYETGFELAISCFGMKHPMSERLKACYSDLFSSLHYKHFVRNGEQRDVARQALKDSEIAITHLRASYYASERHKQALQEQTKRQTRMLAKAGTDASLAAPGTATGDTSTSSRPGSRATSRSRSRPGTSKSKRRGASSRPNTAAHRT